MLLATCYTLECEANTHATSAIQYYGCAEDELDEYLPDSTVAWLAGLESYVSKERTLWNV